MNVRISVANRNPDCRVNSGLLKQLARRIIELQRADAGLEIGSLEIALVDDAAIAKINEAFLGRRGATDVIAFLYPPDPSIGGMPSGEVIISSERAIAQARQWSEPVWRELALYLVHGILHLSGHRDRTRRQSRRMRRRESDVMRVLRREFALSGLLRRGRPRVRRSQAK